MKTLATSPARLYSFIAALALVAVAAGSFVLTAAHAADANAVGFMSLTFAAGLAAAALAPEPAFPQD